MLHFLGKLWYGFRVFITKLDDGVERQKERHRQADIESRTQYVVHEDKRGGPTPAGQPQASPPPDQYQLRNSILTPTEYAFAVALFQAKPSGMLIQCKVRLEDIVMARPGLEYRERQRHRNSIKSRHIDFLVCSVPGMRPIVAIELDDPSHNTRKAKAADELKNHICGVAGLQLVRIPAAKRYSAEKIKATLSRYSS